MTASTACLWSRSAVYTYIAVISLVSGSVDPLPPSQGDTLQGVAKELEAVLNTGHYQFAYAAGSTEGVRGAMELIYRPLLSAYVEEAGPLAVPGDLVEQHWNREQINDFVRKLGFLDSEGAVGVRINHFLHLHQVGGGRGRDNWSAVWEQLVNVCIVRPAS